MISIAIICLLPNKYDHFLLHNCSIFYLYWLKLTLGLIVVQFNLIKSCKKHGFIARSMIYFKLFFWSLSAPNLLLLYYESGTFLYYSNNRPFPDLWKYFYFSNMCALQIMTNFAERSFLLITSSDWLIWSQKKIWSRFLHQAVWSMNFSSLIALEHRFSTFHPCLEWENNRVLVRFQKHVQRGN